MRMLVALLMVIAPTQRVDDPVTSPASSKPEYGFGLSPGESLAGWISLYDGNTAYGWTGATVDNRALTGGRTTATFGSCELKGEIARAGDIVFGDRTLHLAPGSFEASMQTARPAAIQLGSDIAVKSLHLKPASLKPVFNQKDLAGWKIRKHPMLPDDRQAQWSVVDGTLRAIGGPGAVESDGQYGDLILQVEVRTRSRLTNGGVFFRCIPGQFMNGYEAQIYNGCYDTDPARPARYSTGAIDDRQLARRLVSRDLEPFVMTVVAAGPHIATWVNGHQMTDWTDTRSAHENPRTGLRLEAGTLQLQAHDPETDVEFRRLLIGELR